MANETMSKTGWLLKEKRELCVRVYNSSVINGADPKEALKRSIEVIDKIFETYSDEESSTIRPL